MSARKDIGKVMHPSPDRTPVDRAAGTAEFNRQAGLSEDLLQGADEIAAFMFGDAKMRRKVYHLAQNERLPIFKMGARICARRSTLMAWIEKQEQKIRRAS